MQSLYRILLEVEIRHDYFKLATAGMNFPADYDISSHINITPSAHTAKILRDHRMMFKTTKTGFTIYAQAEFINTATGYATLIDAFPELVLSFYWTLRDNRLLNYTNHRLSETEKRIYYFSNRTGTQQGLTSYLNQPIPAFGVTYNNEPAYRLGDIVSQGGQSFEMIDMDAPAINFPANIAKWQSIDPAIIHYVNQSDRIAWQSGKFQHQRPNTNPGEFIFYSLADANGTPVDLQMIPGTTVSESEYRAPLSPTDPVSHSLNLDHLLPGKYTLTINEIMGPATRSFFVLNETIEPYLFAVSEFFVSGAAAPFQFITHNTVINRWVLDDPAKTFLVRFRNRLTRWRYLKQDQTLFHQAPTPRPLTKTFSNYSIVVGPNTIHLPDPAVDPIVPEVDVGTKLLKNIYSQIFLTK